MHVAQDIVVTTYLECQQGQSVTALHPGVYAQAYIVQMCGEAFFHNCVRDGTIRIIEEAPL